MGSKKIVTVRKNTGTEREIEAAGPADRSRYVQRLGEKSLELDRAKLVVKGIKDEIDKLKADIEAGDFSDENQLPMFGEGGEGKPDPMSAAQAQAAKNGKSNGAAEHA